jgi:GT2 family glycosyltransferase
VRTGVEQPGRLAVDSKRVEVERDKPGPEVTVAILNYDGRELLEVVLPSLAAQKYRDFETVVVDDCSTDDSLEYLRRHWPQIRVVSTGEANVGVAAALNVAVSSARGRLLALLNNDIELDPGWLGELVSTLERHPEASSVACKLLNYWRRDELDGAGDVLSVEGSAHGRGNGERDRGQFDSENEVFAPTAGAALYRRSAFSEVGAFDESFVAYFEDVDWGLRAQLMGWRSRYVPNAIAYHMGSATTNGVKNPLYYEMQRRNIIGVLVKDMPTSLLIRHAPTIVRRQLGSIFDSVQRGMLIPHMRALLGALIRMPRWLRARRRIQKSRRISTAQLEAIISKQAPAVN